MSSRPPDLLLGVDVGTSGCKVAAYDVDGHLHGAGHVTYALDRPRPGAVEQDPERWWSALVLATRRALATCEADAIRAIALSSANALLLVDSAGRPVRPAIMQLDRRAEREAAQLRERLGTAEMIERTGSVVSAGPSWLPTLAWLRVREPRSWETADALLFPGGWIAYRLTGELSVDYSRAATTSVLGLRRRTWCEDIAAKAGVDHALLPPLRSATDVVGLLGRGPGHELGLPEGIPVAAGAMDSVAAALGAGATAPGHTVVVLGTTGRFIAVSDRYWGTAQTISCAYPCGDQWLTMGVVWGAGRALRWAASQWSGTPDYPRLEAAARRVGPLPFPDGQDPATCEPDFLESLPMSKEEKARLALQQVARAVAVCGEPLRRDGELGHTIVVGGGSRSDTLTSLIAAELGDNIVVPRVVETEPLGAAVIAGVAAGAFRDLAAAVSTMVLGAT